MQPTKRYALPVGHTLLPGPKTFSLVLWKKAAELLQQHTQLTAYVMAGMLGCTEKTAEGMLTDYRKLKAGIKTKAQKAKKK